MANEDTKISLDRDILMDVNSMDDLNKKIASMLTKVCTERGIPTPTYMPKAQEKNSDENELTSEYTFEKTPQDELEFGQSLLNEMANAIGDILAPPAPRPKTQDMKNEIEKQQENAIQYKLTMSYQPELKPELKINLTPSPPGGNMQGV